MIPKRTVAKWTKRVEREGPFDITVFRLRQPRVEAIRGTVMADALARLIFTPLYPPVTHYLAGRSFYETENAAYVALAEWFFLEMKEEIAHCHCSSTQVRLRVRDWQKLIVSLEKREDLVPQLQALRHLYSKLVFIGEAHETIEGLKKESKKIKFPKARK